MIHNSSSEVTPLPFIAVIDDRVSSSMTVEAAIAVPVYLFFLCFFVFLFRVMSIEEQVVQNLSDSARYVAATMTADDEWEIKVRALKYKDLWNNSEINEFVDGGVLGINLSDSYIESERLYLIADYSLKYPIQLFGKRSIYIRNIVTERLWTGAKDEMNTAADEEEIVFITPTGSAYHKYASCSTLDLSISSVPGDKIKQLRNAEGRKYTKCSCVKKGMTNYYITDYGKEYHGSLLCPNLKRTVLKVSLSKVGNRHPCKKCYGG